MHQGGWCLIFYFLLFLDKHSPRRYPVFLARRCVKDGVGNRGGALFFFSFLLLFFFSLIMLALISFVCYQKAWRWVATRCFTVVRWQGKRGYGADWQPSGTLRMGWRGWMDGWMAGLTGWLL